MTKTCFIISSIGEKNSEIRELADVKFDLVYNPILKEFDYKVTRADKIGSPSSISYDIVNHIINSDLVIADVSDLNPNVFYELAIRNACNKPVIVIKGIDQKMPFDIYDKRAISLDMADARQWVEAKDELKTQVSNAETDPETASKSILTGFDVKINPKKDLNPNEEINLQLKDLMSEVRRIRDEQQTRIRTSDIPIEERRRRRKRQIFEIFVKLNTEHNLPVSRTQLRKLILREIHMPSSLVDQYIKMMISDGAIIEVNTDQLDLKRNEIEHGVE